MIKAMIKQSPHSHKHLLLLFCVKTSEQRKSNFYIKICLMLLLKLSILADILSIKIEFLYTNV